MKIQLAIDTSKIIHEADSKFLSIALDCSLIAHKWKNFNATLPQIVTLAKGLGKILCIVLGLLLINTHFLRSCKLQ